MGVFLVPLFCQTIQGYSAMQTGLIVMPMALITGLIMPVAGRLFDLIGAFPLALAGFGILILNTVLLSGVTAETPIEYLRLLLILRGVGTALSMMPVATAGMNAVPQETVGRASSLMNVVRQVAASFGIALTTYVFTTRATFHTSRLLELFSLGSPAHILGSVQVRQFLGLQGSSLPADAALALVLSSAVQKKAAAFAIGDAFWVSLFLILVAVPPVFLLTGRGEASGRTPPPEV